MSGIRNIIVFNIMRICVVGMGYVGLVSGACLAKLGHEVIGVEIDDGRIEKLRRGTSPIYEPGLEGVMKEVIQNKKLSFTHDLKEGLSGAEVILNAVGTPPNEQRRVELKYVWELARQVGERLDHYAVFVNKSTVPVGTADEVKKIIQEHSKNNVSFDVASNPEFLREGSAIHDFMNPDRIVVGVASEKAKEVLQNMYRPLIDQGKRFFATDIKSAELIKYASNSFLAAKIAFINEIANLCDSVGADVREVARGMGFDSRIGEKFLEPGPGYGGSCFPKDVDGLIHVAADHGMHLRILESVAEANRFQRIGAIYRLRKQLPDVVGKTIAVWGLSFKPNTDDVRESAAIEVIGNLVEEGARVKCYDPVAGENAKKILQNANVELVADKMEALTDADALVLMTQWDEFRALKPEDMKKHMKGNVVIDMRNIWDRELFEKAGLIYEGVGR